MRWLMITVAAAASACTAWVEGGPEPAKRDDGFGSAAPTAAGPGGTTATGGVSQASAGQSSQGGSGGSAGSTAATSGGAGSGGLGGTGGSGGESVHVDRPAGLGKYEPPDGKTLLIIGQNTPPVRAYASSVGTPAGFMTYSGIRYNEAFKTGDGDPSDGLKEFFPWTTDYSKIVMQVALYFRDPGADAISSGQFDSNIDALGSYLKAGAVPVFLRVEYEVNRWFSDANAYVAAYKHIVTRLRNDGVHNVAFVFHPHDTVGGAINNYYPGDDWVDWVAVSMLPNVDVAFGILDFGSAHGKPLMIAEATPAGFGVTNESAWFGWFEQVTNAIHKYDIKALCYVNQDWSVYGDEGQTGWGDSRVETRPTVLERWRAEIDGSRYLKNGAVTYAYLGYE